MEAHELISWAWVKSLCSPEEQNQSFIPESCISALVLLCSEHCMRDKLTDMKGNLLHGVLVSHPQQLLGEKYTQSLILQAMPVTCRKVSRIPAFPNVPLQLPLSTLQ